MFAEFLVHTPADAEPPVTPAFRYALGAASAFGAHLTALVYQIDVETPVALRDRPPSPRTEEEHTAVTASALTAAAERAGVPLEVVTDRSYAYGVGETLADFAHLRDVTILDHDPRPGPGSRLLAQAALFDSGRPVILVPPTVSSFAMRTVLIAWDSSRASVRAVHDAMPFLQRAERVVVTRVTDDGYLRQGHSGLELCRHLARHGVTAEFNPVDRGSASVSEALAGAAGLLAVDLLVMGGAVHSRIHDLLFGSVTRRVLEGDIGVPVLLSN
ncbi:universal stress protein [Prosthecomicrobium sp. N25]|uniref:universal stress protein n=1 Tax=Prosthecomicrobium sp. N25 TaxID=3129254 RepID=UPI00307702CC